MKKENSLWKEIFCIARANDILILEKIESLHTTQSTQGQTFFPIIMQSN